MHLGASFAANEAAVSYKRDARLLQTRLPFAANDASVCPKPERPFRHPFFNILISKRLQTVKNPLPFNQTDAAFWIFSLCNKLCHDFSELQKTANKCLGNDMEDISRAFLLKSTIFSISGHPTGKNRKRQIPLWQWENDCKSTGQIIFFLNKTKTKQKRNCIFLFIITIFCHVKNNVYICTQILWVFARLTLRET